MKKILILTAILGTVAFGAEAPKGHEGHGAVDAAATTKMECPMMNGEAGKGTGMGMNHGNGDGTGKMMQGKKKHGNKHGQGQGRMMESLSQKDRDALTKNRDAIKAQLDYDKPDWNKVQKLSDENATTMSRARVEMMKKRVEEKKTKANVKAN